ncbi:MAG: hypothetical protein ACP6IY_06930 [Promethearchaeia archaeon]
MVQELIKSKNLEEEIIKFLNLKGKIRAALLLKLENKFCKENDKPQQLYNSLYDLLKNKKIEILIIDPFELIWKKQKLSNLTFLEDSLYYIKNYFPLYNYEEKDYFFDSRKYQNNNLENKVKFIFKLINEIPKLKSKIIIILKEDIELIKIYEDFKEDKKIKIKNLLIENKKIICKIKIPLERQQKDIAIIENYRNKFMCFYITIIEAIQNLIVQLQTELNINQKKSLLYNNIRKFAHYCRLFVESDWIDMNKSSPGKWETFFIHFNIPIRLIDFHFKNFGFYNRTFEALSIITYGISINKKEKEIIKKLKNLGYSPIKKYQNRDNIFLGLKLKVEITCPAIEYYYFIHKYLIFYHLFLLFYHCSDYLLKIGFKFSKKEFEIYKLFFPVLNKFFNINPLRIVKNLSFSFKTYNAEELDILYNHFLMERARNIEKKMYNYFMIKYFRVH